MRNWVLATASALGVALLATACSPASGAAKGGMIVAVGAESEYANVIQQVGGQYVHASAIMSNPSTDPHTFEASASVSQTVGAARLVVQNGIGYDTYMNRIEAASPNAKRKVIIVQKLLGVPDSAPNPHLWYSPATMPAVARAVAKELSALQPGHARYFRANQARFLASLRPWLRAIAAFKARYSSTPVAVTEPVGDYLLQAMGTRDLTPFGLQADVMNGVDLPAQYVSLEETLLNDHKVKVFVYNQQVVDSVTQLFLATAHRAGVPVVGVYETMPTPGYSYQSWMLAEVHALQRAVAEKTSTEKL